MNEYDWLEKLWLAGDLKPTWESLMTDGGGLTKMWLAAAALFKKSIDIKLTNIRLRLGLRPRSDWEDHNAPPDPRSDR